MLALAPENGDEEAVFEVMAAGRVSECGLITRVLAGGVAGFPAVSRAVRLVIVQILRFLALPSSCWFAGGLSPYVIRPGRRERRSGSWIRAAHMTELRSAVRALE